jgi:plasmid maintenance system antidote protein VapI
MCSSLLTIYTNLVYKRVMKINAASEKLRKMLNDDMSFAMLLKSIRSRDELTQKMMANKLGVSVSHVSDLENGRKFVSVERASFFAKKLGDSEKVFIMLALQDQVNNADLDYQIKVA